jgi:hypothetical protein
MKNNLKVPAVLIMFVLVGVAIFYYVSTGQKPASQVPANTTNETNDTNETKVRNPASVNCTSKGGELKIITETDGSQFGLCQFNDYACEEWAYFRNECDIEGDGQKIRQELIAKGLDLSKSKVVIKQHLGEYIGGSVAPIDAVVGGGYVFAVKEGDTVKVLADGNGAMLCSYFKDYPDFSAYLVPECVDEVTGKTIVR